MLSLFCSRHRDRPTTLHAGGGAPAYLLPVALSFFRHVSRCLSPFFAFVKNLRTHRKICSIYSVLDLLRVARRASHRKRKCKCSSFVVTTLVIFSLGFFLCVSVGDVHHPIETREHISWRSINRHTLATKHEKKQTNYFDWCRSQNEKSEANSVLTY